MISNKSPSVLLALDASIGGTGWALFSSGNMAATGVIGADIKRGAPVEARLSRLTEELDLLVDRRRPDEVAYSLPSGIHWTVPALDLLRDRMDTWSKKHGLPAFVYTAKEVRAAIGGHSRVSQDKLAYEVMTILGLIGQGRTAREWKALAVGCHHLSFPDSSRDSS